MLILAKIILIVYLLAINVYGFLLLSTQKKNKELGDEKAPKISDGKLFLCGLLGGSLTIYLCMFLLKYRLTNFLFMVIMPIFIALNGYVVFLCFSQNFGIIV